MSTSTPTLFLSVLLLSISMAVIARANVHGFVDLGQARGRSFILPTGNSLTSPVSRAFSNLFYAEVTIGNPPSKVNLALETATSPTWVQSAKCQNCFNVSGPTFDPNNSVSFKSMPAYHPICTPDWLTPDASGHFCTYVVTYMENQYSVGDYGFDTFTFFTSDSQQQQAAVPSVAFGVGVDNQMDMWNDHQHGNPIAGILGLARGHPSSIVNQLTIRQFSYCLPEKFGDKALLFIGEDANLTSPDVQRTPIMGSETDLYYLRLEGISLNGTRLPIDPEVLMRHGHGIVIDSGAPYSSLVDEAYDVVHHAVKDYFVKITGEMPLQRTSSGYDLCYDLEIQKIKRGGMYSGPGNFSGPPMAFHFLGGATLELHDSTTFQEFPDINEVCFMIYRVEGIEVPNVLGAFQQLSHRFLFDVAASILSFSRDLGC